MKYNIYSKWIKDEKNNTIILKGVSKTGLEYLGLDLNTITPEMVDFDIQLMKKWKINSVRIPLRDTHWLYNNQYRDIVDLMLNKFNEAGYITILDLHTQGENYGLDPFILREHGIEFWKQVSEKYKDRSIIFFELFNEPHNIEPNVWWNGNEQYYGYKEILHVIRNNTNNICIIGGLDYAFQWNFLKYHDNILKEMKTIPNIALSIHPYGYRGGPIEQGTNTEQIPTVISFPNNNFSGDCSTGFTIPIIDKKNYGWDESFGYLRNTFPIIATEWGLDHDDRVIQGGWYSHDILEYFNKNGISYIAWAWVQDRLSYPSLLDEEFNPTGRAVQYPYGPACSVKENDFYPGPGQLVYNDLHNQHRKLYFKNKTYHYNETDNYNDIIFIIILFFSCILLGLYLVINIFIDKKRNFTSKKIISVPSKINLLTLI